MPIGAHVSIAGGIANAPARAAAQGCECFQIFTRSPQGGAAPPLTDAVVAAFRAACDAQQQSLWVVHTPYYINLASAEARIRGSSARVIREELERASRIGAQYVMAHLGSAREMGEEAGRALVVQGLTKALEGYDGSTTFCIEIAAGAGAVMGDTFEEIAALIAAVEHNLHRAGCIGVCFDTQHAFGAGYDLRTPDAVATTVAAFDATIGRERLRMSHVNDSKVELGQQKDRHEHIGKGHIGADGIRAVVQHPAFHNLPLILETEDEGREEDVRLLKMFRDHVTP
ncbi:deoxyribonuclease IV [Candidatus Uhrbacteria bacterium]|nr:deoxyribonuclease IV [Candidatus Uhrbacteria bacterium]